MAPGQRWQDSPDQPSWLRPARRRGRLKRFAQRWRVSEGNGGPLRRETDDCMAGGVAAGVAARTGYDVSAVRIVFGLGIILTYGVLAMAYEAAWLLIPAAGADSSIGSKAMADKRGIGLAVGLASALCLGLGVASVLDITWLTTLAFQLLVCAAGMVLIWRNASEGERENLRRLGDPVFGPAGGQKRSPVWRILLTAAVVLGGVGVLVSGHPRLTLLRPLGGLILVVVGILIGLGPWWMRIWRDLVQERQARIRAEERADMASQVHDSVLQTLALIQRRAADPQQVVQLARAQERELRSWLFDGVAPGSMHGRVTTFAAGIRLIQQEVEAQHGISVEAVTVGDCGLDDDLNAVLAAAREATVNAAKWSGADVVSLFAEAEPTGVTVYVRDRGKGFDPGTVPGDRKGLAESVHARMARRGGTATVRSAPGEGTEVSLTMPRHADDSLQSPA